MSICTVIYNKPVGSLGNPLQSRCSCWFCPLRDTVGLGYLHECKFNGTFWRSINPEYVRKSSPFYWTSLLLILKLDTHKLAFSCINLREIWVLPIPPKPCKRKDFLWTPVLELKWVFSFCKYSSRPVKKKLGFLRGGRGGRGVSDAGWLHWFIYERLWLLTSSTSKLQAN